MERGRSRKTSSASDSDGEAWNIVTVVQEMDLESISQESQDVASSEMEAP